MDSAMELNHLRRLLMKEQPTLDVVAAALYLSVRKVNEHNIFFNGLPVTVVEENGDDLVVPDDALAVGFAARGSHIVASSDAGSCLEQAIAMGDRPQDLAVLKPLIEEIASPSRSDDIGIREEFEDAISNGASGDRLVRRARLIMLFVSWYSSGSSVLAKREADATPRLGDDGEVALVRASTDYVVEQLHELGVRLVVEVRGDCVFIWRKEDDDLRLNRAPALREVIEGSGDTIGSNPLEPEQDVWFATPSTLLWGNTREGISPTRPPHVTPMQLARAAVEALREFDAGR
jgi:hypothetical protein